jgi:glutamate carboxypeptidase
MTEKKTLRMDLSALRDELISWANINSGSGNVAGLEKMRATLAAAFGKLPGARVEHVPLSGTPAHVLRISIRPTAPRQLLFSGHYDTVYAADHPFQRCDLANERTLRGPGVADMKGGLMVMLAALREFETSPAAAQLGYEILLTPDEETGSVASRPIIESAARSKRFAFALVFEPARANGDLVKSRKGVGLFKVISHGRAAHAGRDPQAGRNAIVALAGYLPQVHALNDELEGMLINIGAVRGGGVVNIVPDYAEAELNIRINRISDEAVVLGRLRELAAPINAQEGYRLEIAGRFNRLPKEASPVEERIFAAWQACGRELGVNFSWQHVAGGSDGNLLAAAGLPNLDGVGPVGDHLHSPEEFVNLSSLGERARVAARFLEKYAAGEFTIS